MCISATKNDVNKCISVYKKKEELEESASQTPGPNSRTKSLVKRFEKMKSSYSNDIASKNLNLRGGTINRPIGCSKTEQPKMDFFVTKFQENLHHSDWARRATFGQSSEWGVGYYFLRIKFEIIVWIFVFVMFGISAILGEYFYVWTHSAIVIW